MTNKEGEEKETATWGQPGLRRIELGLSTFTPKSGSQRKSRTQLPSYHHLPNSISLNTKTLKPSSRKLSVAPPPVPSSQKQKPSQPHPANVTWARPKPKQTNRRSSGCSTPQAKTEADKPVSPFAWLFDPTQPHPPTTHLPPPSYTSSSGQRPVLAPMGTGPGTGHKSLTHAHIPTPYPYPLPVRICMTHAEPYQSPSSNSVCAKGFFIGGSKQVYVVAST
ncbi:hypothetical protein F5887DRAFT_1237474 [Amanita rubescens]|nr:hypothetical protein F5887DRAFT_1237474 [Amanita rubescens]